MKELLDKKPQPDINSLDGKDNGNTALHLPTKGNESGMDNSVLSEGTGTAIENGDGRTPLELVKKYNNVENIDIDIHSNSHAAAPGKQAASTFMLPFSGELRVDKELKLSHGDFKQSLEEFYANKQFTAIDQLNDTPPYPTPNLLAQFANMAYKDSQPEESELPKGWKLLTAASNKGNGYFGTAYWHRDYQQVVIAHRGTDHVTSLTNVPEFLKDICADIKGVVCNMHVDQMNSASTFANKVVAALQEIEQDQKVSFDLFFTGHSLGGWLAQITTFTTEYLEVKGGTFLKKQKIQQGEQHPSSTVQESQDVQKLGQAKTNPLTFQYIKGNADTFLKKQKRENGDKLASSTVQDSHDVTNTYHPHTVAFESPGCKDMLSQMADNLDVRLHGCSIHLQHLDITSYLSAPNIINTCKRHLGTVYRIFTDLSDMGRKEKHTPLYNLATHSMDKIVEAFDPETGQIREDEKGEPKIKEVVDWPVSARLTGEPELKNFFKWAKHLNNYHPDVINTVPNKVPKGYHQLRYQTKAYDKSTISLRGFTQDEREFLEHYLCLSQLQNNFEFKDYFSVMSNPYAEQTAQQMLKNLKLDNERILCPDTNTLHKLVPYVKRLVRLFPHIKEKVKEKLSSSNIIKRLCRDETKSNVENIPPNALNFQPGALGLSEFLDSDQQILQLRMIDGDEWTGVTEVYWVLQNTTFTPSCFSEGHYTVLKLNWLLTVKRAISWNALLECMETPHLLLIACGKNQLENDEQRNMFKELMNILKEKEDMKIILTVQLEDDTADFIQEIATKTLDERFVTTDEELTWRDLTAPSQSEMLKKTVTFYGRRVALSQLTSAESMRDLFPLFRLLHEKVIRIGEETVLSACSGYNENYYIDRTFKHNIVIRQDIINDKKAGKFSDLLARTEQEFQQFCQQNPTSNVHWLVEDKSGELVWQQSKGNLNAIRKYIDAQKSHSYDPSNLDKLLQQAKHQKVMIIADKAGMGKSTVLTKLSNRIKQKYPAHWLVRIDLNDYTELLKDQEGMKMDKGRVLQFVSKEVLKLKSHLERQLFEKSFEENEISKVVVMVDGFDEISPKYKETVIDMLQVLKQTSLEQLWVTTRPHLREELEDNLQQISYSLEPFSEKEQFEFLKKFWLQTLNPEAMNHHQLQIYAEALIRNLAQSISDKDRKFTGIPLQTRMLAEAFENDFRSFYESQKTEPELPHKLDLVGLYRRFIERKYEVYYKEKFLKSADNMAVEEVQKRDSRNIEREHQSLALNELFPEDPVTVLQFDDSAFPDEQLARIGIVQRNSEGQPQFIHRTFAEYLVAEFLIKQLTKKTKQHKQVQKLLLNVVLLKEDCQIIRAFLDGLLEKCKPTKEALREYGGKLDKEWKEREVHAPMEGCTTALHEAAKEDNAHIIGFLLDSLKSGECLKTLPKLLLAKDHWEQTAWHKAAENDSVQALKTIWKWAEEVTARQVEAEGGHLDTLRKHSGASDTTHASVEEEKLQPDQLKNKLFLSEDQYGNTAWHGAAKRGSLKALETLWSWAKEAQINPDELLLTENKEGSTAWQLAGQIGHLAILQKIGFWVKEEERNPNELMKKFLLAKDQYGYTAWYRAAESGSLETLEKVWSWAKETELKPNEMLLAKSEDGNTAWQVAAQRGHFEVLEKLWQWAKGEQMDGNVLKDNFLLAKDKNGNTAWHRAAERGSLEALQTLWSWSKEAKLTQDELKENWLLVQDKDGNTAWHLAADRNNFEVFKNMWVWAKEEEENPNKLKKKLLLVRDQYGYTVWHRAAQRGGLESLENLWGWAKSATKPK